MGTMITRLSRPLPSSLAPDDDHTRYSYPALAIPSDYVDAGEKTDVDVSYCSAYDTDDCGSDGCRCEKSRDGSTASYSRWSCAYDIAGKSCEICYTFDEPQVR